MTRNDPLLDACFIVDADVLVALVDSKDEQHTRAHRYLDLLVKADAPLVYPMVCFIRAFEQLHHRGLTSQAQRFMAAATDQSLLIEPISAEIAVRAASVQLALGGTPDAYHVALVSLIAQQKNAKAVFTFNPLYSKLRQRVIRDLY